MSGHAIEEEPNKTMKTKTLKVIKQGQEYRIDEILIMD